MAVGSTPKSCEILQWELDILMLQDENAAIFYELIQRSYYRHDRTRNLIFWILEIGRAQGLSDKEIGDLLRKQLSIFYSKAHVRALLPKSCKDQSKSHPNCKKPIFATMTMQKALDEIDSKQS